MRGLGEKQENDKARIGLTIEEAERLIKDGVAYELDGGWQPESDERDKSVPTTDSKLAEENNVVVGNERKAEDQAERRSVSHKN
jgi:hypothetical protein